MLTVQKTTVHHGGESMAVGVANAESGEEPADAHLLSFFPPFYLVYNSISWGGTTHIQSPLLILSGNAPHPTEVCILSDLHPVKLIIKINHHKLYSLLFVTVFINLPIAVIRHLDRIDLREKKFVWVAHISQLTVHHSSKSQQQELEAAGYLASVVKKQRVSNPCSFTAHFS